MPTPKRSLAGFVRMIFTADTGKMIPRQRFIILTCCLVLTISFVVSRLPIGFFATTSDSNRTGTALAQKDGEADGRIGETIPPENKTALIGQPPADNPDRPPGEANRKPPAATTGTLTLGTQPLGNVRATNLALLKADFFAKPHPERTFHYESHYLSGNQPRQTVTSPGKLMDAVFTPRVIEFELLTGGHQVDQGKPEANRWSYAEGKLEIGQGEIQLTIAAEWKSQFLPGKQNAKGKTLLQMRPKARFVWKRADVERQLLGEPPGYWSELAREEGFNERTTAIVLSSDRSMESSGDLQPLPFIADRGLPNLGFMEGKFNLTQGDGGLVVDRHTGRILAFHGGAILALNVSQLLLELESNKKATPVAGSGSTPPTAIKTTPPAAASTGTTGTGITEADLGRITQLIQADKTGEAQQAISQLLAKHPKDPNARKLQTLLGSLGGGPARVETPQPVQQTASARPAEPVNSPPPVAPSSGPSAQETIEWIRANLDQLWNSTTCRSSDNDIYTRDSKKVSAISINNGDLIVLETSNGVYDGKYRKYITFHTAKITVHLQHVTGQVQITKSDTDSASERVTCTPAEQVNLRLESKPNSFVINQSTYTVTESYYTGSKEFELDGVKVEKMNDPSAEVEKRAHSGHGKNYTSSRIDIPIKPEFAERFKNAFDHLIKLHGGGKPAAF